MNENNEPETSDDAGETWDPAAPIPEHGEPVERTRLRAKLRADEEAPALRAQIVALVERMPSLILVELLASVARFQSTYSGRHCACSPTSNGSRRLDDACPIHSDGEALE